MKWRAVIEITGADRSVRTHEIGDGAAVDGYSPRTIGLSLAEGKAMLAGVQHHLVEAQTNERATAHALVTARRSSDAEGPDRDRQRDT